MPKVSVILPTYNHAEYVREALDSALSQTYRDIEVIVINDGSPDNTGEVLKPYVDQGLIRYVEQENRGQAHARNRGIELAEGEYIAMLDDDDIWPEDKLEWQVKRLENSEWITVGGTAEILEQRPGTAGDGPRYDDAGNEPEEMAVDRDEKRKTAAVTRPDETTGRDVEELEITFESLFSGSPFLSPGQVLIRTDAIRRAGGLDPEIWGADDLDLYMRLSKLGRMVKCSRQALWYRLHETNASHDMLRMMKYARVVLLKNLKHEPRKDQKRLRKTGYRWLYMYLGTRFAGKAARSLRSLDIFGFIQHSGILFRFYFIPSLKDVQLFLLLTRDFLPARLLTILRYLRPRKSTADQ